VPRIVLTVSHPATARGLHDG